MNLSTPTEAMMFFELGCNGQSSTTRFHGLSGGNTSRAAQIASASGVLNSITLSIFGILSARMRASRAGSPVTLTFVAGVVGLSGVADTTKGVTVTSTSKPPTL